jgi:hypothetical protein
VWVQEHLDARLEMKSPAAKTLQGVLKCLSDFLPRQGHGLTDLVTHDEEIATRPAAKRKSAKRKSAKAPKRKKSKASRPKRAQTKPATKTKATSKSKVRTARASDVVIDPNRQAKYTGNTNGSSDSLGTRIRDAALAIAGAPRRRVRLRDLRERLADVPREQLDRQLFSLQEAGALVLYRIDDPTDIDSEDERASVRVAGFPRHILYLEH